MRDIAYRARPVHSRARPFRYRSGETRYRSRLSFPPLRPFAALRAEPFTEPAHLATERASFHPRLKISEIFSCRCTAALAKPVLNGPPARRRDPPF